MSNSRLQAQPESRELEGRKPQANLTMTVIAVSVVEKEPKRSGPVPGQVFWLRCSQIAIIGRSAAEKAISVMLSFSILLKRRRGARDRSPTVMRRSGSVSTSGVIGSRGVRVEQQGSSHQ